MSTVATANRSPGQFPPSAGKEGRRSYVTVCWEPSAKPQNYEIVANLGGDLRTIGQFRVPKGSFAGRMPVLVSEPGPFIVVSDPDVMDLQGTIALFTRQGPDAEPVFDPETTSILGKSGTLIMADQVRSA